MGYKKCSRADGANRDAVKGLENVAQTIAFVGLGTMGGPMAHNIARAGFNLRVYNRTQSRAESLRAEGALVCDSPGEAATGAEIVVSMLSDDAAVEAVTSDDDGILNALPPGGIHLSMSTLSADAARRLSQLHDLHDQTYVAGPVFGRPDAAAAGKLWILLSGDPSAKAQVGPVCAAMGQGTLDLGDDPTSAHIVKICNNFLIGAAIAAMGEAFTLAERSGVDRKLLYEILTKTTFAAPVYVNYGRLIASETFTPSGFGLPLGQKDIRLAEELARDLQVPLPLAHLVQDRLTSARAKGRDDQDWACLTLESSEAAGLEPGRLNRSGA